MPNHYDGIIIKIRNEEGLWINETKMYVQGHTWSLLQTTLEWIFLQVAKVSDDNYFSEKQMSFSSEYRSAFTKFTNKICDTFAQQSLC